MSKTMRAIATTKDAPLALVEMPRPVPGPGQILIDVRAAGLNRGDLLQRAGHYPPPPGASEVMGLECAGLVAEIGEGVTEWSPGQRVCALLTGGGYGEMAVADAGSVMAVPDGMSLVDAAGLPEAMLTVWANVFERCALQPGEIFLCHGGTSGIGTMAIQMARRAGAGRIIVTAGSDEKCAFARDLGADEAVNYREADFADAVRAAGGVDVILDMVGGDYVQKHIDLIRVNGRICNIAYQAGAKVTLNLVPLIVKRGILTATTLRARTPEEKQALRDAMMARFWADVEAGAIKPVIDSTFPLAEAEAAQARMASSAHIGKIILTGEA